MTYGHMSAGNHTNPWVRLESALLRMRELEAEIEKLQMAHMSVICVAERIIAEIDVHLTPRDDQSNDLRSARQALVGGRT